MDNGIYLTNLRGILPIIRHFDLLVVWYGIRRYNTPSYNTTAIQTQHYCKPIKGRPKRLMANMIGDIQQLPHDDPTLLDEIREWLALYHDQPISTKALHTNLWDLALTQMPQADYRWTGWCLSHGMDSEYDRELHNKFGQWLLEWASASTLSTPCLSLSNVRVKTHHRRTFNLLELRFQVPWACWGRSLWLRGTITLVLVWLGVIIRAVVTHLVRIPFVFVFGRGTFNFVIRVTSIWEGHGIM